MSAKKIIVVGGGIGGLGAAIALLQRGFEVEVLEQAGELREVGAGIQLSPNGARALNMLGVFETLRELSCHTDEKEIRQWQTGRAWKLFSDSKLVLEKYGFPYLTVFRPDLLRCLGERVRELSPDAIRLNARCEEVEQRDDEVVLTLQDGTKLSADIVVGADGIHSMVRSRVFGADDLEYTGMSVWRSLIPMENVPPHLQRNVAVNWCGPGGHVVHYPVNAGRYMNFVATREGQTWDGPPWNRPTTKEECAHAFEGWSPDIHALIQNCGPVLKWALCLRPFLQHWSTARVTLLGDACHGTPPFLAQGAVHAIEDGVILARCLKEIDDHERALKRYEELRLPRTYRMVREAINNGKIIHSPRLATPESSEAYGNEVWSPTAIGDRYEWLYSYQVDTVEV